MKTLIIAASALDLEQLKKWTSWADRTIASDGGYDHAKAIGHTPDMVVGDQDSIRAEIEPEELYPKEKDFTDLEAALAIAVKDSSEIVILGATGGRQDHFLNAIMQLFNYELPIRLIDSQNEIWIERSSFSFETDFPYFSLLPLDPLNVSITGAKYELNQRLVDPYQSLTVSNEPRGRVKVEFEQGRVIVVLSKDV